MNFGNKNKFGIFAGFDTRKIPGKENKSQFYGGARFSLKLGKK